MIPYNLYGIISHFIEEAVEFTETTEEDVAVSVVVPTEDNVVSVETILDKELASVVVVDTASVVDLLTVVALTVVVTAAVVYDTSISGTSFGSL